MRYGMFDDLIPYSDIHNMNLDWIIKKVFEYMHKFIDLDAFVKLSIDEQNALLNKAIKDLENAIVELNDEIEENLQYIKDNIQPIVNEYINELIASGQMYVGLEYIPETEELNIILSEESQ